MEGRGTDGACVVLIGGDDWCGWVGAFAACACAVLHVPTHWTTDDFLNNASKHLGLSSIASHMFTKDGVEIDDIAMVR